MQKIAILGGRIIDPMNKLDEKNNLYIADGKILAMSSAPFGDFTPDLTIDAKNNIVCPGFVDINANLLSRSTDSRSFIENLHNAASIGITHLATQAFSEVSALDGLQIEYFAQLSKQTGKKAKAFLIGALTQNLHGERLNELMLMKEAGCIGFSNGNRAITNTLTQKRCYDYAGMLDLKIFIYLNDLYLGQGHMHEGKISTELGLTGIPALAETIGLAKELALIEETGIKAHFCRISSAKSVDMLNKVDPEKIRISSDVAIHQLFFTEDDVQLENGYYHVIPPFREKQDRSRLREAVKLGQINAIVSDHITLSKQTKEIPFQDSMPGIASWPILLPLTLQYASEDQVPLVDALARITSAPAAILGIDAGHLNKDSSANVVVFDPNQTWKLSESDLKKFGMNNPCSDWQLQGRVVNTIVDGALL